MSHFTTMVFVKDEGYSYEQAIEQAERLLEPFDENTQVDTYERETWTTEEAIQQRDKFADRLAETEDSDAEGVRSSTPYEYLLRWEAYGEEEFLRDKGDGNYALLSQYNPKSKWDWYTLGGRWDGQQIKSGEVRPWGQIKDLDIEGARVIAGMEASKRYDEFEEATKGLEVAPTWAHVRDEMFPGDIDAARAHYNNDPWVLATREHVGIFGTPHETFFVGKGGRAAMVEEARARVGMTYAAIDTKGNWNAKGEMGWFGISSGDDEEAWSVNYRKLLESLDPEDWWFQFDLHI